MGRLLLILLIVVAVVLVWKAFGPGTWKRDRVDSSQRHQPRAVKGPDDDEEFLWNIEKNRFKERRARELAAREEEERMRRAQQRYEPRTAADPSADDSTATGPTDRSGRTDAGSGSGSGTGNASAEDPEGEADSGSGSGTGNTSRG